MDLDKTSVDFRREFIVKMKKWPRVKGELALFQSERDELKITADTLSALLFRNKAILYQREAAPLTPKDLTLKNRVLDLYPHNRPTPFPWLFTHEPRFEVAKT